MSLHSEVATRLDSARGVEITPRRERLQAGHHPRQTDELLADYYAHRAPEMEEAFDCPGRQADLVRLRGELPRLLDGLEVLEIACGTGYWTREIANSAKSVTAIDINDEMLAIARSKDYPPGRVDLVRHDAWQLSALPRRFNAAVALFWWSHVPHARTRAFLQELRQVLEPNSLVLLIDNLPQDTRCTPSVGIDRDGNSYQRRVLRNGERFDIIKNYPSRSELLNTVDDFAAATDYTSFDCLWMLSYRTRAINGVSRRA